MLADDKAQTDASLSEHGFASAPRNRGAIVIYASGEKRTELQANPANALEAGKARLEGGNWAVTGDQYIVEDAQKVLGGKLTVE